VTEVIAVRGAASDDGARGPSTRVLELVAGMGLEAKLAQLVGYWVDRRGDKVAPMADVMGGDTPLGEATRHGLGHFTRVYGTHPVDPQERAAWLHQAQRTLVETTGLPAIVHEECLTGLAAWGATTFPTPLAWGASFDPALVGEMAASVGEQMRSLGIHQGLSPVLDVVRDARWGRVEECLGEDPYLVGELGTAYVRGLQSGGVLATLKHFVGYSASWAGRNLAPVSAGPREIADTLLMGGSLVALSILGDLPWWVTVVILVRELGITWMRYLIKDRVVLPASRGGKAKTVAQALAIGMFVAPLATLPDWVTVAAWGLMAVALALTVVTGLDYVRTGRRIMASAAPSASDAP